MPRHYPYLLLSFIASTGLHSADLEIAVTEESVVLDIDIDKDGFAHYRLDASSDLSAWNSVTAMGILNGDGAVELFPDDGASMPDQMFYRIAEDDSANNVLDLPTSADDYENIVWPDHLTTADILATDNTPAENPLTDEGALLGRVLFYDQKLSANHSVSCASCHQQEHGFSDPDAFSSGFDGGLTGRNSMGLTNAQFYERGSFFWDERAATLEDQVLEPIQNAVEMGLTLETLVERVDAYAYYEDLFIDTFGDSEVTSERIALALAQFVRSIVSTQSKYDLGEAEDFANFTAEELQGMSIFNGPGRCVTCHDGPNFVGERIDNNGLEFPYVDLGVGDVSGNDQDLGKFKMSSLRNIEKTAPYMHDGRFATLEEVIEHYNSGIVDNPNLGNQLRARGGVGIQLNLSQADKDALLAFLLTLTDSTVLTDSKWSDPFAEGAQ